MIGPGVHLGGRYRLVERIASGCMGDVWLCWDETFIRAMAVKILPPSSLEEPGFSERFRAEAQTMAAINHKGVVDVYDYGSDPAIGSYVVTDYVEGDALSRTLARDGRLTAARTLDLIAQAAEALQEAHDKGIVHRDIKPGNLLVRPDGTLVLTDFGIARSIGHEQLTADGVAPHAALYVSPEQFVGEQVTHLSDIYALGVIAYQCLSGRRPFEGESAYEIAMRHARKSPPPLPMDVPPTVRAIVERAMAKKPRARWQSATALAQACRRAAGELVS
jgi:eukaryotic-like serine/threonine-protein kinase